MSFTAYHPNRYRCFIIFCDKFIYNQLFAAILPSGTYFWTLNRLVRSILKYLVTGSDHAHFYQKWAWSLPVTRYVKIDFTNRFSVQKYVPKGNIIANN